MVNSEIKISIHPALQKILLEQRNKIEQKNNVITKSMIPISENETELDDIKAEHSAEPLKNVSDIKRIRDYFLSKGQYRNHMLFVMGINVGLRISDLLNLKFSHIIDVNGEYRDWIVLTEKKTGKTRKFALSNVSKNAIELYIKQFPDVTRDTYLFRSESNNNTENVNNHMSRRGVQYFINKAFDELKLPQRHGTHILRKTFAYHALMKGDAFERARSLEKLQRLLNHSSSAITLRYAGITDEEVFDTYTNMDYDLVNINLD